MLVDLKCFTLLQIFTKLKLIFSMFQHWFGGNFITCCLFQRE